MAGRIPQAFIDDLVSRIDIVELINQRVPLKRKGHEYTACCPFHNEKTPSFTVSETKQFYHCFGCGAHGTAIGFLMEYENLDFVDAVEALAAELNIEVPREETGAHGVHQQDDKQPLFDVLEQVSKLYQQQLKSSQRAIEYLRQRGLSGEIAKRYSLGYAPDEWHFLPENTGNNHNNINKLEKSGMIIRKASGKPYDRFRDRIMFPILDRRGRTIAFGGRIIDQGEPKYLNSPETPVFHKGYELYGFCEARRAVRNLQRMLVVEGYMDVVALAQHGIEYAVASLGTATTQDQIQKLFRTVNEVIFCYDGDRAGHQAAWRALENTLPVLRDGLEARFLFLPDGEDPDTMIRKEGRQAFESRLDSATPLSEYLFDNLARDIDIGTVEGKARLKKEATPLLNRLPDSTFRDLLFQRLSDLVGIGARILQTGTAEPPRAAHTMPAHKRGRSNREIKQNAMRDAIALLLQNPGLAQIQEIPEQFARTSLQGFPLLHELHKSIMDNPGIKSSALLERWRDRNEFEILQKLMQRNVQYTDGDTMRNTVYQDAVRNLVKKYNDDRYEKLDTRLREGGLSNEEMEEYKLLLKQLNQ